MRVGVHAESRQAPSFGAGKDSAGAAGGLEMLCI